MRTVFNLDPIFCSKFIGVFTSHGNRSSALSLFSYVIYRFRSDEGPLYFEVINLALKNITPKVSLSSSKKGGIVYKMPYPLSEGEGLTYSVRWLHKAASKSKERTLELSVYAELSDAASSSGSAYQRCSEFHSLALSNSGFMSFLS